MKGPGFLWLTCGTQFTSDLQVLLEQTATAFADGTLPLQSTSQAYRSLARVLHPDKGGNAAAFAALQAAFETLSDPQARAAYDSLAADLRFRPGAAAPYSNTQQVGNPAVEVLAVLPPDYHKLAAQAVSPTTQPT